MEFVFLYKKIYEFLMLGKLDQSFSNCHQNSRDKEKG